MHFLTPCSDGRSYMTSSIVSSRIERRPRAPVLRLCALMRDRDQRFFGELQIDAVHVQIFWNWRTSALRGSVRMRRSASSSSASSVTTIGRRPMNSGIKPKLQQIFRHQLLEELADAYVALAFGLRAEAHVVRGDARLDDPLQTVERAAADEQHVGGVDLNELLVRMLASALRRNVGGRAFENLEQRLLHAFARDVAGDRRVLALARDLVDLVDVDDALLGALDVVVGGLDELEQNVLDVFADVAGFGQRGCVGHRQRHVENLRQRLREIGLARAGRPDQQNVRLLQLDVVGRAADVDALVVVVDRDRERLLGALLTDHVLVEDVVDLFRLGNVAQPQVLVDVLVELFLDDLVAELDALVANVDAGAGDQFPNLLLRFSAEAALQLALVVSKAKHPRSGVSSSRYAGVGRLWRFSMIGSIIPYSLASWAVI